VRSAAAGSRNLIIARVIETKADLQQIRQVLSNAKTILCQLRATAPTLLQRVRTREHGTGRQWHEARAIELTKSLASAPADFTIGTDGRTVVEIAQDVVE
jgi:hypothetical protein